jgi:glyoxylate reductase
MSKVFVGRVIPEAGLELLRNAPEVSELVVWPEAWAPSPEQMREAVADCEAILNAPPSRIDDALLDAAPHLKVVANIAVGVDTIDVEACHKRGVLVGNTPDVLTDSTADVAWALLMATAWRITEADHNVRCGQWGGWKPTDYWGTDVSNTTLGVVGFGRIGQAVARRAKSFGMEILYWNRSAKPEAESELGARRVELDALLRASDFVSVNCALTDETRGLLDASKLALMKPSAILVNTARGAVIDEAALAVALKTHKIRGAGLDVFEVEPLPKDSPLNELTNVVMAPHVGSATERTRSAMARLAARNILAGLRGEPLPAPV